jgi:baculoviral IAP repeat-containing protein 1
MTTSRKILRPRNESHKQYLPAEKLEKYRLAVDKCRSLLQKHDIYSSIEMQAAGFRYTNVGDTAFCNACDLQVSNWTRDTKPFTVHAQRSPMCTFVRSMQPANTNVIPLSPTDGEKPPKRPKIDNSHVSDLDILVETEILKEVRKRTFSHYPHRSSPTAAQMMAAGFFSCNINDRVICLYCNLICQQWKHQGEDPLEIHCSLSPKCPYVMLLKAQARASSIRILNEQGKAKTNTNDSIQWTNVVYRTACHPNYMEMPRREISFATWSTENMPSVEGLVRAGFFYTGTKSIVTCFYCNGSLQNWSASDNPTIEHARWFPQCAYAKQLCGPELYRKIRKASEHQQGND